MADQGSSLPEGEVVWSEADWAAFERDTRRRAMREGRPDAAWDVIVRASRRVMRTYTTSFFIVSRFLPRHKRDRVEVMDSLVRLRYVEAQYVAL